MSALYTQIQFTFQDKVCRAQYKTTECVLTVFTAILSRRMIALLLDSDSQRE